MFKQKIPKKIKVDSWDKWIGEDFGVYNCLCCDRIKIKQSTFHAGHFKSEKNGGKISVNNIIPICSGCNSSMGSKNMDNYLELFEPERYNFLLRTKPKWFICNSKTINSKLVNNRYSDNKLKYTCWRNTLNGIVHNEYYEHKLRGKIYYISDDKYKYIYNKLKNNKVGKEIGKYSQKGYPIYYNKINNIKKIELFLQRFNLAQLKQLYLLFFYKSCHLKKKEIINNISEEISFNEIKNIIYNLSDNIKYIKSCQCKFVFLNRKTKINCKKCNSNFIYYNNLII
tara:strand:- start:295 stop:1143 length:849 start_codon:yes stop_codon:yes gene_type:complete